MLYLEDYLEMIEHLPSELRDRFTEMREIDLSVQNSVDTLDERQSVFFANCRKMKPAERDEEYEKIKKEYSKVVEDSNEKVLISEENYGLVDRYLRKLDHELHKFKMELEADNRGITEILEKHSLELDQPANNTLKENRHPKKHSRKHHTTTHHGGGQLKTERGGRQMVNDNLSMDSMSTCSSSSANVGLNSLAATLGNPGSSGQSVFSAFGVGVNPLAAAASQAIAATQQLTGRRTSSLKASFEAINLGLQTHEFALGRDIVGLSGNSGAESLLGASTTPGGQTHKRKKSHSRQPSTSHGAPPPLLDVVSGGADALLSSADDLLAGSNEGGTSDQDWNLDPTEPRYCICNQVSYGDMVACDNNEDCPHEWFHYPCVGITAPPKGKWFCPSCSASMARRKGRK